MKLTVKLGSRKDDNGNGDVFYMTKGSLPISIDFADGVAFLIFTAKEGQEEMQISHLDEDCLNVSFVSVKNNDKMKIRIYPRQDKLGNTYYVGKLKMDCMVDLNCDNSSFMIWNSIPNREELQITGRFISPGELHQD